ncbi:MAG: helix-turn-helix domain-containing protein [Actinomycetota bacterium]|nr:helix-turn-helix domain-containing protein [Actinomycetota bacterium]
MLLAGDGVGTNEIVSRVGVSKPTVMAWKKRYAAEGIGGLADRPKPGRSPTIDDTEIVLRTLEAPPGTARRHALVLASAREGAGVSNVKVAQVWREWGLQPWRVETFKFSTDRACQVLCVRPAVDL